MEFYVGGGCSEHGRNSFFVRGRKISFLVDAGLMKENPAQPFPDLSENQVRSADYLFLTHCHVDHCGALLWLYERGFRGKVIASRITLETIPGVIKGAMALEDLGTSGTEIRLEKNLSFTWGRSGHCLGSVWFLFNAEKKRILFTGDYSEKSAAYRCDPIRGVHADLAVIDAAYGNEMTDAGDHLKALDRYIAESALSSVKMFFPVPVHGRGFDVLKILADHGYETQAGQNILDELSVMKDDPFWLRKKFRRLGLSEKVKPYSGDAFEDQIQKKGSSREETEEDPRGSQPSAIVLSDSQLSKEENRKLAFLLYEAGGITVLTGKQDPASYARMLLNEKKAVFLRISVHQNKNELIRLAKKNDFRYVVPFHCREELHFIKKKYLLLHVGDSVKL
ncbi:MAG TPA: MBL fold metallo-hydrolase [Lachnospiraceae bacterium]|nr:MBL fold metallo-hydrolase [Lachnospiraceae bacterium]